MKRPAKKHTYDDTLLVTVLILVLVGLILLTSTSAYNGRVKFHDSYYYLKKQGLATVLGMAGMLWIARIDYHRWIPLAVPGYLAAIGLSIAVMAFGKEYNGSKRWLSLGPVSGLADQPKCEKNIKTSDNVRNDAFNPSGCRSGRSK